MSDQKPIEGEVLDAEPDKLQFVGKVVKAVAGYGVGVIVGQVVAANVAPKNLVQKVGVVVGGAMLCGLVAHHVGNFAQDYTDEFIESCRKAYKEMVELQDEIRRLKDLDA